MFCYAAQEKHGNRSAELKCMYVIGVQKTDEALSLSLFSCNLLQAIGA